MFVLVRIWLLIDPKVKVSVVISSSVFIILFCVFLIWLVRYNIILSSYHLIISSSVNRTYLRRTSAENTIAADHPDTDNLQMSQDLRTFLDIVNWHISQVEGRGNVQPIAQRGLSDDMIMALPHEVYDPSKIAQQDDMIDLTIDNDTTTCSICLDDYVPGDAMIVLACHHKYHVNCITSWLKRDSTCPLCKQRVGRGEEGMVNAGPSTDQV